MQIAGDWRWPERRFDATMSWFLLVKECLRKESKWISVQFQIGRWTSVAESVQA